MEQQTPRSLLAHAKHTSRVGERKAPTPTDPKIERSIFAFLFQGNKLYFDNFENVCFENISRNKPA